MQISKSLFAALATATSLLGFATGAPVDCCDGLTQEQQSQIGLNACSSSDVVIQSVPELITEYLDKTPYTVGSSDSITNANLIGLQEGSTSLTGLYEASYNYYNYNQCYNFETATDMQVYLTFGQSDEAGLYCYYSNWGCYGEEVCIKNNGNTIVPVSDDVRKTGIKSTMLKRFHDSIDTDVPDEAPKNAISWVY
ncbi:hypothetical protein K493DRAFT_321711 [Basidiobolus meristosporus CBS 931.73]|uniref:Uncharacterized protein n=1 Tax=Basidiobolus meristosporus CBS 931.73 TaxID=1314790 RepID=A0A1Y1WPC6_9FUNG|nr:hypothetical protein K493DRAFT_321813 [Basidiobolus meristosporus CBS 931.73]ORX75399.1 hypothetical protein K493DRAFT_321711 [Basidiobolus meristosporus CBS 931.73]|eukprot:ORX68872.1 hypothetical protein K493DRAFT_321813 [Basidiobolus meristosporus CBS 931.73]